MPQPGSALATVPLCSSFEANRLSIITIPQSARHRPAAMMISIGFGEKISTNPFPFTNAEKLETQKGIRNRRKVGQNPSVTWLLTPARVLRTNATPMIRLRPNEVSQSRRLGSKYRIKTTQYQIK